MILDIFNGSGSTGKAVAFENRERNADYKYIGIELEKEYCEISKMRIDYAINKYQYDLEKDIKEEEIRKLKELGAIKLKDASKELKANVRYLTQELNQTQVQTLVNYMYSIVLKIVGIPSQSDGNTGDSSNNGAVILKLKAKAPASPPFCQYVVG